MDLPTLDIGQTVTHVVTGRASKVVARPQDAGRIVHWAVWIDLEGVPSSRSTHLILAHFSWEGWDPSRLEDCTDCRFSGRPPRRRAPGIQGRCLKCDSLGKVLPQGWQHRPLPLPSNSGS
jgi:hypothetical protein